MQPELQWSLEREAEIAAKVREPKAPGKGCEAAVIAVLKHQADPAIAYVHRKMKLEDIVARVTGHTFPDNRYSEGTISARMRELRRLKGWPIRKEKDEAGRWVYWLEDSDA